MDVFPYSHIHLPWIVCAASMAYHGVLGSVWRLFLSQCEITSVPAEQLSSLTSSVIGCVFINNVSGCDLVTILDSVKSSSLNIASQSLDSEETQALVRAMETRVERVKLGRGVTLDIGALMEYSGQGKCNEIQCQYDSAARYKDHLKTCTTSRNWKVANAYEPFFHIQSPDFVQRPEEIFCHDLIQG